MVLLVLLLICFYACDNKPYPRTMLMADSLMNLYPDSALTLLEQLSGSIAKEPKAARIYYQLLTIKAKDKAYITHTSDSVIKQVVNYYENEEDEKCLPEAYYYAGRVCRDLSDAPQALDCFQKAIENITENTNCRLISMIYYQTGMLYLYQHIFDKSLLAFKKACHYAVQSKDSTAIIYNLREIGRAFTGQNNIDSTLYYYQEAEYIAEKVNNTYLVGILNQEIAGIYTQLEEYPKAYTAIQKSLCTSKRSIPAYYATLADLYYETGKIDSARYYYTQLCSIGDYYHKQGAYEGLSKIARQQGELTEAFDYMDKYLTYTDSINETMNAEAIHKVNALYNYQLREKENYRLKAVTYKQEIWIIALLLSIACILIICIAVSIIYLQRRKRRKIQAERQQEKLKRIADEQYYCSQQYIKENERRIETIKEKLQNTENQRTELENSLQESEKELLELTNKQIETRKKIQTISEKALKNSQIYKDFYHVAGMPNSEHISDKKKISQKDWEELAIAVNSTYNNFTERLQVLYPSISKHELWICMLLKISIIPTGIANLTAHSKQAITSSRKKLYEKIHNQPGTPDLWDEFIRNF